MKKKKLVIPVFAIVLFGAWYAFRPERLFVNHRVHEELPTAKDGSPTQILATGTFHSVLHPTAGTAAVYAFADGSRVLRLTNFRTSNGPDVHIYLVAAGDARSPRDYRFNSLPSGLSTIYPKPAQHLATNAISISRCAHRKTREFVGSRPRFSVRPAPRSDEGFKQRGNYASSEYQRGRPKIRRDA